MIALHHGGANGHSASVLIALAEKGLAHEDHALDLAAREQHGAPFLALNPAGQVPVLEEAGRTLTETFFILLYLDDRYPAPPLGGANPRARYLVQKWGKYVETHIAPNLAILGWVQRGRETDVGGGFERLPLERRALWSKAAAGFSDEDARAAKAALMKAVDRIAEDLADGPWLAGSDYTIADIIVFPHVVRVADLGIAVPELVLQWLDRVAARPQVRAALGENGIDRSVATMGPERGRWG